MRKLIKNMKLIVAVSTMLAMFAAAPVVYGGISWTGIDPIFMVNDQKFNVKIEYPSAFDCDIDGLVEVRVEVPQNAKTQFIAESSGNLSGCTQKTRTKIVENKNLKDRVNIMARISSSETFPVRVRVAVDGTLARSAIGRSNEWVKVKSINLKGSSEKEVTNSDDDPDELVYTYEDNGKHLGQYKNKDENDVD